VLQNQQLLGTTADEFLELSTSMRQDGATVICELSGMNVAPYSKFLQAVMVQFAPGIPVELRVTPDDRLLITGDRAKLATLSRTMGNFGRDWSTGQHIHIEYYEGNTLLSPSSIPAVLTHL